MKRFLLHAVLVQALLIAAVFYMVGTSTSSGFGSIAQGIGVLEFGIAGIIVTFIVGLRYSPAHRIVYGVMFVALFVLLFIIGAAVTKRLTTNEYEQNTANELEMNRLGMHGSFSTNSVKRLALPQALSDTYWSAVQDACRDGGFNDISKYAGKSISLAQYSISQRWNGLPMNVVFLDDRYTVLCVYREVASDDGVTFPPNPNVISITETRGITDSYIEPVRK